MGETHKLVSCFAVTTCSQLPVLVASVLISLLLAGCSGETTALLQKIFATDEPGKELTVTISAEDTPKITTAVAVEKEIPDEGQYERLLAVWILWQNAVRDGAPDSAIATLKLAEHDPSVEVSGMAKKALANLRQLKEKRKTATVANRDIKHDNAVFNLETDPQTGEAVHGAAAKAVDVGNTGTAEYIKSLSLLIQNEPDKDKRAAAVREIGLHRNDAAVEALTKSASDEEPGIRYRALQTLWFSAADGLDKDGAITATLENALSDSDPQVAKLAEDALADLRRLKERNEAEAASPYMDNSEQEFAEMVNAMPGPDGRLPEQVSAMTDQATVRNEMFSEKMEELATRVRFGADTEERFSAVNELGLYRTDESVNLLTEAAADGDPGIRYQALKTLWYSAADGLDKDGKITDLLRQSITDNDPRVAELASQALEDLKNLEEKKQKKPLESYFSPSPNDSEFPTGIPPHLLDGSPPRPPQ